MKQRQYRPPARPQSTAEATFPFKPSPELELTRCKKCHYMLVRGVCPVCSAKKKPKPKRAS